MREEGGGRGGEEMTEKAGFGRRESYVVDYHGCPPCFETKRGGTRFDGVCDAMRLFYIVGLCASSTSHILSRSSTSATLPQ